MSAPVLLAPVSADIIASAFAVPRLRREVAFGTRQGDLALAPGAPVFIYAAQGHAKRHPLHRAGLVTWRGTLGRVVPAVSHGSRRGMHPDPAMRPPFAEATEYKDAALFWHVLDLEPLDEPIAIARFRDASGAKLFNGPAPLWIAPAWLKREAAITAPRRRQAA